MIICLVLLCIWLIFKDFKIKPYVIDVITRDYGDMIEKITYYSDGSVEYDVIFKKSG